MKLRCLVVFGVLAGLSLASAPRVRAQSSDTSGTDFWVTFPSNLGVTFATLNLFITGNTNTTGTVTISAISFSMPFSVTAGQVTTISVPIGAELENTDLVESKGIHITALANVTVYGLSSDRNPGFFSSDAYLGLPTTILGTDYLVLGYQTEFTPGGGSQYDIVATANSTTVTITPSVTTGTHQAGVPYTVMLNQGQTYQYFDMTIGNDLTGTSITSNQPIALFGGNQCADVPPGASFCNLLVEELPPTSAWGTNFLTEPLATRTKGDTFRFLASKNMTHLSINGTVVATLNRGQFFEQVLTTASQITSDQPILVAQYSNSGSFDGASADPFMMLVPPAAQYLASYTVTTPAVNFPTNFVNIVAQTSGIGTIKLDGTVIASSMFSPIGTSGFSGAQVPLTVGSHNLTGGVPFMVIVYGFFTADGYGYIGGFSLSPIALVTKVTLAPKTITASISTQACVTATVTDQNSMPVGGVRVDFSVTGANPTSGFTTAAANGQAQFCYMGAAAGADTVMAAVGSISDTATVTWSNPTITSPGTFSPAPGTGTNATVQPGSTAQFTVIFQPNPGFVGMVTFTCTNSIPNTKCTVTPATANITSSAPVTLTIMLQTNCTGLLAPFGAPRGMPPGWGVTYSLALAGALILWNWGRRRSNSRAIARSRLAGRIGWLVPSLALALLMVTWAGCSSTSSDPPLIPGAPTTPPGAYTIVITGTSAVGSQSMSLNVRVI